MTNSKVLDENSLVDLGCYGLPFAWYNNCSYAAVILKDRKVMSNQQRLNLYKEARVENLPIIGSNHDPILLKIDNWNRTGKLPPFRLETKIVLRYSFMALVNQTWRRYINRSSVY